MAAQAPWRQLSPHNAGCYPDAIRQIMQWIWWEARIDHNHVTMCFLCNICSHVSGYRLVKRAMMELALLKRTLHLGAMHRIRKTTTVCRWECASSENWSQTVSQKSMFLQPNLKQKVSVSPDKLNFVCLYVAAAVPLGSVLKKKSCNNAMLVWLDSGFGKNIV